MNGGHYNEGVVPAYELWKTRYRNVRLYELHSVLRTEGMIEQCAANYPGSPIQATVSLAAGYVGEGTERQWVGDAEIPVDLYWRIGESLARDPRVTSLWLYPGPGNPKSPRWFECFGAFVQGATGVMLGD